MYVLITKIDPLDLVARWGYCGIQTLSWVNNDELRTAGVAMTPLPLPEGGWALGPPPAKPISRGSHSNAHNFLVSWS